MHSDRRLQNLLYDSEFLLLENAPVDNFTFKAPSKLRKIIREKNEQSLPSEPRQTGAMMLNINFPEIEKTLEATKTLLKFEPVASTADYSHLSYFPVLHNLTFVKTDLLDTTDSKNKLPFTTDAKIESYRKYVHSKHLDEIGVDSAQNMPTARRSVASGLLKAWDNRLDRVMDSTINNKETLQYDPQQINLYLPFVTRKMEKVVDSRKFAYINHVYNYVQMSRIYERPRVRPDMTTHNILNNLSGHYFHGESMDQGRSGNLRNLGYGVGRQIHQNGHGRSFYQGQDSFSIGGSISEELYNGASKLGYSILPRPEKAKLIIGILEEFSMINQNSQEGSIYLILKELFKGMDFGPKDPSLSKKELSIIHINELLNESCKILQIEFFEQSKRMAKRRKLEASTLNGRQIETIQIILGFVEEYILTENFSMENIIIRDEDGLPIWALLFFILRAGLTNEFEIFCEEYRGSFVSEVRHLYNIYRDKSGNKENENNEIRAKFESDVEGFGLSEFSDVFKRTIASLFGGSDELADSSLLSEIKDFLWFNLYRAREYDLKNPHYRLLDLQRKIQQTEKEFSENGEILELVKIQILTLMFTEAIDTLNRVPNYFGEAAQLCFLNEEARLIKLQRIFKGRNLQRAERKTLVEDILFQFADEIARKFPIEAIAYLCAIENPLQKAKTIKNFIDKNDLLQIFFNTTSNSLNLLDKLKGLLNKEAYEILLNLLSERSDIEGEQLTIPYIRVLEEAKNINEILQLVIEQEYIQVQRFRSSWKLQTAQLTESLRYLERLYNDNINKSSFITSSLYKEVLITRSIRSLFSLYYERKNPKAAMEFLENQKFFEIEFKSVSNKLKILYLELISLALKIYIEYKDSLKVRTLSYDSSIRLLRSQVKMIETYFYEQVLGSTIRIEKPFSNFDEIEGQIKDLISILNANF